MGLVFQSILPVSGSPRQGRGIQWKPLVCAAPPPPPATAPPKSATHCCLGLESKWLTGFLKNLELVIPAAGSSPMAGQRGSQRATCAAHGPPAALPGNKPESQEAAGTSWLRPGPRTSSGKGCADGGAGPLRTETSAFIFLLLSFEP